MLSDTPFTTKTLKAHRRYAQSVSEFLQEIPKQAINLPHSKWTEDQVKIIASVFEKASCVVLTNGKPKDIKQYHTFMENVYAKLEIDQEFEILVQGWHD